MANSVAHTIDLIFNGVDNVSAVMGDIRSGLDKFSGGVDAIVDPFADIADSVLVVDTALATAAAGVLGIRAEFDSELGKIQSSLGTTAERAEELGAVAKQVFADGFGKSIGEAVGAVTLIEQKFADFDLSGTQITSMAENAFALADQWETDAEEALLAVKSLMSNFNMGETEAFDFITSGFQQGLNSADDFFDTVNEYSTQFGSAGVDAGEFFSIISTGFQEGVLGTDKAADAFKEFTLLMVDWADEGSDAFAALKDLSLDPTEMLSMSSADAFQTIIDALKNIDDQAEQTRLGAELIGTQFEDLKDAALNIDVAAVKMGDLAGATDGVYQQYETLTNELKQLWRTAITEIVEINDFDGIESKIAAFVRGVKDALPEAVDGLDFSGLTGGIDDLAGKLGDLFGGLDLTDAENLKEVIQSVIDSVESITSITGGMAEAWERVFSAIGSAITWFNSLDDATKESVGNLLGLSQQAVIAAAGIGTLVTAASGLSSLLNVSSISGATASLGSLATALGSVAAVGASGFAGWEFGRWLREQVPGIDDATQSLLGWVDGLVNFSGTQGQANESVEEAQARIRAEVEEMRALREQTGLTATELGQLAETPAIDISVTADLDPEQIEADRVALENALKESGVLKLEADPVEIAVSANTDTASFEEAKDYIVEILPDGSKKYVWVGADTDTASLNQAKKDIEAAVPDTKVMKIEAELEAERIKAEAATIEAALKYKAEVDVAEIQAAAKITVALSETIASNFASTGEVISGALNNMAGLGDSVSDVQYRWTLTEQLEKENELRERQVDLQEELTKAQVDYMNAKTDAMERGEAMINVSMDGRFQPALEFLASEFIKYVQIEATEEGLESLIGV